MKKRLLARIFSMFNLAMIFTVMLGLGSYASDFAIDGRVLFTLQRDATIMDLQSVGNTIVVVHSNGAVISRDAGENFMDAEFPGSFHVHPWSTVNIFIDQRPKILIAVDSDLFVSSDTDGKFLRSRFSETDEKISAIESIDDDVFVTFGSYHEICAWNKILISRDGGKTFTPRTRFGEICQSYHDLAFTPSGLFAKSGDSLFVSTDRGETFAQTSEENAAWQSVLQRRQQKSLLIRDRVSTLPIPETRALSWSNGKSFPLSYMDRDFNSVSPTPSIVYEYNFLGRLGRMHSENMPRRATLEDGRFYYATHKEVYVVESSAH